MVSAGSIDTSDANYVLFSFLIADGVTDFANNVKASFMITYLLPQADIGY